MVEQNPEYFFELKARFNVGNSAGLYVEWVERHYQVLRTMVRRMEPRVTPHTIMRTGRKSVGLPPSHIPKDGQTIPPWVEHTALADDEPRQDTVAESGSRGSGRSRSQIARSPRSVHAILHGRTERWLSARGTHRNQCSLRSCRDRDSPRASHSTTPERLTMSSARDGSRRICQACR